MAADVKNGETNISSREWLRAACNDLEEEIQRAHNLSPQKFPLLGFDPDYLTAGGGGPLLNRWRNQLGDERFLGFLNYWYWHSMASRPLAFVGKVAHQLGVFYSTNCPAFSIYKRLPLASWAYAASFSWLSHPQSLRLLAMVPAASDFLERTKKLRFTNINIPQDKRIRTWNIYCARTYLAILLLSVPLAICFLLKRSKSEESKWPAFFVILLYSANFGNVLGISVVHTMEVARYSTVQFIGALFAQLWAIRWLFEIALTRLDNIKVATSWSFNPKPIQGRVG
jgi:hypothetical protein